MVARHHQARDVLRVSHEKRRSYETRIRIERHSTGLRRVWSHVTGQYSKIERRNEIEALECYQRDRMEKDNLILGQLDEQQSIQIKLESLHERMQLEIANVKEAVFSKWPETQINVQENTNTIPPKRVNQSLNLDM